MMSTYRAVWLRVCKSRECCPIHSEHYGEFLKLTYEQLCATGARFGYPIAELIPGAIARTVLVKTHGLHFVKLEYQLRLAVALGRWIRERCTVWDMAVWPSGDVAWLCDIAKLIGVEVDAGFLNGVAVPRDTEQIAENCIRQLNEIAVWVDSQRDAT